MVLGEVHWLHGESSKVGQEKYFRWNFYLESTYLVDIADTFHERKFLVLHRGVHSHAQRPMTH